MRERLASSIWPTAPSSARPSRRGPRRSCTGRWSCWSPCSATALAWSAARRRTSSSGPRGASARSPRPSRCSSPAAGRCSAPAPAAGSSRSTSARATGSTGATSWSGWRPSGWTTRSPSSGRTIRAGRGGAGPKLGRLGELLEGQSAAARSKAEAELAQARAEVRLAQEQRDVGGPARRGGPQGREGRGGRAPQAGRDAGRVAPRSSSRPRRRPARRRRSWHAARLPVNEERVQVAQRALELAERDYEVKREELELKRQARQVELETARIELANRELEREQAVIRSPIDGIVTAGDVKVGDLLEPGKSFAEVAEQAGFRFEASVPSEEVGRLAARDAGADQAGCLRLPAVRHPRRDGLLHRPRFGPSRGRPRGLVHRADRAERGHGGPRAVARAGATRHGRTGGDRDRTGEPAVPVQNRSRQSISLYQ